jgi:hypothetical protein
MRVGLALHISHDWGHRYHTFTTGTNIGPNLDLMWSRDFTAGVGDQCAISWVQEKNPAHFPVKVGGASRNFTK